MSTEMDEMIASQGFIGVPGQPDEITMSETRSRTIVGPVSFKLYNLRVAGKGNKPADPANSPFIIAANEDYEVSVDVEFNRTPLTELLMCLGTRVCVNFGFEGMGIKATEIDVSSCIRTVKDKYVYRVQYTGRPDRDGLKPGLYEIGAVATVGPVDNKCTTKIWGHGYIKEVLLQVYPAGQE